jgi:hypothetical protein
MYGANNIMQGPGTDNMNNLNTLRSGPLSGPTPYADYGTHSNITKYNRTTKGR